MTATTLAIGGRDVSITHPDRVLWPAREGWPGWTKRDLIGYYRAVAPAILPHLAERAITLARFPEGIEGRGFYQTDCPAGAPDWVPTVSLESPAGKSLRMCLVPDEATLIWAANGGTIEFHPYLAPVGAPDAPHAIVFDLDPGAPAGLLECARLAIRIRAELEQIDLRAFAKRSGAKGMHVYAPVLGGHGQIRDERQI
jgi:bifunctional non-homologous end joining protein LigD